MRPTSLSRYSTVLVGNLDCATGDAGKTYCPILKMKLLIQVTDLNVMDHAETS